MFLLKMNTKTFFESLSFCQKNIGMEIYASGIRSMEKFAAENSSNVKHDGVDFVSI